MCTKIAKANADATKGARLPPEFNIPFSIIAFCAPRIKELIANPEEVTKWELIPWSKFKQLIYNIYEHRIDNAAELQGGVNSSYCPINEHILIYFVDLLGSRELAEEKVVELLVNTISFYNQWPRVKLFAANLQILGGRPGPD